MKNILYFYPDNAGVIDQGNNSRAYFLLKYFNKRNFNVDLVSECHEDEITNLKEQGLINNFSRLTKTVHNFFHFFYEIIPEKIYTKFLKIFFKTKHKRNVDLNKLKKGYLRSFENILKTNDYDIIIISYTVWSPLIQNIKKIAPNAKTIIDTHDFITAQHQNELHFNIGYYFRREIETLKFYDEVWAISIEEYFIFDQFLEDSSTKLVPHGTKNNVSKQSENKTIDLLYVASDNPHNVKSIAWFLQEVYPKISKEIKITFVGKICKHVPDIDNITKIPFVKDLDTLYKVAKVCLCPMLTGTGLKIKVVEALSYGLPVVCNTRGVDGLLNKIDNGCLVSDLAEDFSASIIRLLNDENYYHKIQSQAASFFEKSLSEDIVHKKLDEIFSIETKHD